MRKKYDISSFAMLCAVLGIYGIYLMIIGIITLILSLNVGDLNNLSSDTIKSGQYVQGFAMDCVKKPYGPKSATGLYSHDIEGITDYSGYTIVLQNGEYVRFLACSDKTIEALEKLVKGEKATFPVKGRITPREGLDTIWYQGIPDFDETKLIPGYVIKEGSPYDNIGKIIAGIIVCVVSFVLLRFVAHIEVRSEIALKDYSDHNDLHHMELELNHAKNRLSQMQEEEKKNAKQIPLGVVLIVLGVGYCAFVKFLLIIGLLSITWGIKKIWIGFINSENPMANRIADRWKISTIQSRKEPYRRLIGQLEEALQKKMNQ